MVANSLTVQSVGSPSHFDWEPASSSRAGKMVWSEVAREKRPSWKFHHSWDTEQKVEQHLSSACAVFIITPKTMMHHFEAWECTNKVHILHSKGLKMVINDIGSQCVITDRKHKAKPLFRYTHSGVKCSIHYRMPEFLWSPDASIFSHKKKEKGCPSHNTTLYKFITLAFTSNNINS